MDNQNNPQEQKPQEQKVEEKKEQKPVQKGPGFFSKLKETLVGYRHVIEVARKPDKEEFMSNSKVMALGIAIVGVIGFIIFLIYEFVMAMV